MNAHFNKMTKADLRLVVTTILAIREGLTPSARAVMDKLNNAVKDEMYSRPEDVPMTLGEAIGYDGEAGNYTGD